MSKTPIYIALPLLKSINSIVEGSQDVINLINRQFPNNFLMIKEYLIDGTLEELKFSIDDFLITYPSGNRVIITETTSMTRFVSEYIFSLGLDIPTISFYATSPSVRTFKNTLTYAPIDKYSAMSQFLIYKDYKMEQIKILYNPNTDNDIFIKTYIEQIKIQANLLDIRYEIEILETGKNFYNIAPRTLILILSDTLSLTNNFVNQDFLNNIPPECFITLTDYNLDIGDIFGNVPSFVLTPFPIDYTSTSTLVYENLTNKANNLYTIYTLYDILYSLVYFTGINLPLTLQNYVSINPFQAGVFPSFIGTQSNLDLRINGIEFGLYITIFTKNSLVQNDNKLFEKYNQGGTLSLSDSTSIFKVIGIVPFFNQNIFYGDEDYYKIYDECGNLIIVRFSSNITTYPFNNNALINVGQKCNNRFYCKYTPDKYFNYLESVTDAFNNNSIVNLTMSKTPILKVISK